MMESLARQIPGRNKEFTMINAIDLSNLNPVIAQALAPFVQPALQLDADQLRDLETIDNNIRMFSGYGPAGQSTLDALVRGRAQLIEYWADERDFLDVDVVVRNLVTRIPAWGTYGT